MTDTFKITIHMVSSLDGLIAKEDNSVAWFETSSLYEKGIEVSNEEAEKFLKTIDCYVMGARTYELAVQLSKTYGWAYGNTPTIVLTHRNLPVIKQNIELYSGGLNELVNERLKTTYKNVWVVGGAMVANDFIRLRLAHEIRLSVLPILLGKGKLFFNNIEQEQLLHLKDVIAYKNGMIELKYELIKE